MKPLPDRLFQTDSTLLKFFKTYRYHVISWIIFMLFESFSVGIFNNHFAPVSTYLVYYVINIFFFYVHLNLVMGLAMKYRVKSRFWSVPFFILIELGFYLLVMIVLRIVLSRYTQILGDKPLTVTFQFLVGSIFRCIYFIGFSTGYYFLYHFGKERRKTMQLENQRMNSIIQLARSENAYLKAQINPHFLFNTLDFIYQQAKDKSPVAAETIHSLSNMMRYAVDSGQAGEYVSLGGEIDQVENLINLHQLRQDHSLHIRFWYDDDIREVKIIPLILITLAENIFKHANLQCASAPAQISVSMENSSLLIETNNLINTVPNSKGLSSGMGNISKRLEYAYGSNISFDYGIAEDNYFKVRLMIF